MHKEIYAFFIDGNRYAGPYMTFEAAFSYAIKFQTDFRIESLDDKVLATWSLWTGLYKVGVKYKFLIVDNDFNRKIYPDLVGQTLDKAPYGALVQDIEQSS